MRIPFFSNISRPTQNLEPDPQFEQPQTESALFIGAASARDTFETFNSDPHPSVLHVFSPAEIEIASKQVGLLTLMNKLCTVSGKTLSELNSI